MAFCALNLIYIPAAFLVKPSVSDIIYRIHSPFSGGFQ